MSHHHVLSCVTSSHILSTDKRNMSCVTYNVTSTHRLNQRIASRHFRYVWWCDIVCMLMWHSLNHDDPFWILRFIHYPAAAHCRDAHGRETEGLGCGAHTDYGCLTIVCQDDTPDSPQVRRKHGRWLGSSKMCKPPSFPTPLKKNENIVCTAV